MKNTTTTKTTHPHVQVTAHIEVDRDMQAAYGEYLHNCAVGSVPEDRAAYEEQIAALDELNIDPQFFVDWYLTQNRFVPESQCGNVFSDHLDHELDD